MKRERETVWVVLVQDRVVGMQAIAACATEEIAKEKLAEWCRDWWAKEEVPGEPPGDPEECAEAYFEHVGSEHAIIDRCGYWDGRSISGKRHRKFPKRQEETLMKTPIPMAGSESFPEWETLVKHALDLVRDYPDGLDFCEVGNSTIGSAMSISMTKPRWLTEKACCEARRRLNP